MAKPNITAPVLSEKDIRRFWSKVDKAPGFGPNADCWQWTMRPNTSGYGSITYSVQNVERQILAHKTSWFLHTGNWPTLLILHRCDNKICVNPDHLFEGTTLDDALDAKAKGRLAAGERHGRYGNPHQTNLGEKNHLAKLTEDKVREIRALYPAMGPRAIGKRYGVTRVNVQQIVRRKTWKHI